MKEEIKYALNIDLETYGKSGTDYNFGEFLPELSSHLLSLCYDIDKYNLLDAFYDDIINNNREEDYSDIFDIEELEKVDKDIIIKQILENSSFFEDYPEDYPEYFTNNFIRQDYKDFYIKLNHHIILTPEKYSFLLDSLELDKDEKIIGIKNSDDSYIKALFDFKEKNLKNVDKSGGIDIDYSMIFSLIKKIKTPKEKLKSKIEFPLEFID